MSSYGEKEKNELEVNDDQMKEKKKDKSEIKPKSNLAMIICYGLKSAIDLSLCI